MKKIFVFFAFLTPVFAVELHEVKPQLLPNWETLNFQKSLEVFKSSCDLKETAQNLVSTYAEDALKNACAKAKNITLSEAKNFLSNILEPIN